MSPKTKGSVCEHYRDETELMFGRRHKLVSDVAWRIALLEGQSAGSHPAISRGRHDSIKISDVREMCVSH